MKAIFIISLMLVCISCTAQLGLSKKSIMTTYGKPIVDSISTEGKPYIMYGQKAKSEINGETIWFFTTFYFNPEHTCIKTLIMTPISEINWWVNTFNKEDVQLSEKKWKDYKTNSIITLTIDDDGKWVNIIQRYDN